MVYPILFDMDRIAARCESWLESPAIPGRFNVPTDVWDAEAVGNRDKAQRKIDAVPGRHPFEIRYHEGVDPVDWESCGEVLDPHERRRLLMGGW